MNNTIYPDWVLKHKTEGTTIRRRGDAFILIKISSKRVPGKNYPVVSQEYLGVITKEGLIKKKIYETALKDNLIEYGLSTFLYLNLLRSLSTHISSNESSSGKELIVIGSILYFMFKDISEDILSLTYLPSLTNNFDLTFLTERRREKCKSLQNKIDLYLNQLIPNEREKHLLLGKLRNVLFDPNSKKIINNNGSIDKIISKYNLRMKYEAN